MAGIENESAAGLLLETFEALLPLHQLNVPSRLRNTLRLTNPMRACSRWFGTVSGLSHAHEQQFPPNLWNDTGKYGGGGEI